MQDVEGRSLPGSLTFNRSYEVAHFSQSSALRAIMAFVQGCEEHEIKEWLRLDGRPVYESHPEIHGDKRAWLSGWPPRAAG